MFALKEIGATTTPITTIFIGTYRHKSQRYQGSNNGNSKLNISYFKNRKSTIE